MLVASGSESCWSSSLCEAHAQRPLTTLHETEFLERLAMLTLRPRINVVLKAPPPRF